MIVLRKLIALDWLLTGAAILLVLLGLAMIFSSAAGDSLASARFTRQVISFLIALAAYLFLALLPYHLLRSWAPWIYGFALIALALVSQIGRVIRGATSRLEFIGTQVQPSEFMKVALVLVLAWIFSRWGKEGRLPLLMSAAVSFAAVVMVALEPDIGMAVLLIALWVGMVFYLGISRRFLLSIFIAGLAGFLGAWLWFFADYQKDRIHTFLDPTADPLGAGYNVVQSIVALGSGGLFGRGLGHGPQSQLKFLPEQHTDFIFASIGEELGFAGIIIIIILYFVILSRILKISQDTRDDFGHYVCVGSFLIILASFFVSAGMNMGLLPVTGIPLSFVSYGGSNLLVTFILLGIVQSVRLHGAWVRKPPPELEVLA